ncbi:uncharacterized protein [Procambarus clarkii]|uniref:uncharacterized protein n=1 Tax=Procambarus clarkii TaxID=6728 RepID=UPI001E675136|nr:uncharacterized protein LOC123755912 [Procambarus clarkii]XP_045594809.1 uncharacterized protein LOC123755912 [Procambarus clarkii]
MARVVECSAVVALVSFLASLTLVTSEANNTEHLSRQKRLIFLTSERRLTLPPTTALILTPTLSLPLGRNLPLGYSASMTISVPFKIAFDDLGLTSEENPFGFFPSFGLFRKKREAFTTLPGINWAGGDREMMYMVVEDTLDNMGMNGKACLLRAICEIFQVPLINHGFFGEVLELFFSAGRSPHSEKRLKEYTLAEKAGKTTGDCSGYHHECPHSLFTNPGELKWLEAEHYKDHYPEDSDSETTATDESESENIINDEYPSQSQDNVSTEKTKKTRRRFKKSCD